MELVSAITAWQRNAVGTRGKKTETKEARMFDAREREPDRRDWKN